jgi:hypothetical protein
MARKPPGYVPSADGDLVNWRTILDQVLSTSSAALGAASKLLLRQNLGIADENGFGYLDQVAPNTMIGIDLSVAKTFTSRDQVTTRPDIYITVVGGASDAEWPSPWPSLGGRDCWRQFPGPVRRGVAAKVSTTNSATFFPQIVIPANTTDGDIGVLRLNRGSSTSGTAGTIPGWTFYATYTAATNGITDVYTRTMTQADAGTTLTPAFAGTSQRLATLLTVWGGVSSVVIAGRAETVAGTSHATPTITAPPAGVVWETSIHERSSTPSTSFASPSGTTITGADYGAAAGGSWSVAVADSMPSVLAAGTIGGAAWTATASSNQLDTLSLGFVPAS